MTIFISLHIIIVGIKIKEIIEEKEMKIKPITENDEQVFLLLNKEFYNSNATKRGYSEELSKKTFNQLISKHENLWGYFILHEDVIIGYSLISSYWCNEEGGNIIILDELYVNSDYRHHGYGKAFLKWIENEFRDKAVCIDLEVLSTNIIAKHLYAEDGLVEDGFITLSKKI